MMEAPDTNGSRESSPSPLTGKEWLLLLVLGAVQITHILDFMIVMPLGPVYMKQMGLRPDQFGLMVSDKPRGRVHSVAGRPVIRYDLAPQDLERFRIGIKRLGELFEAAGAREVFLPLPGGVAPEHARALDESEERRKADLDQAKRDRDAGLAEAREQAEVRELRSVAMVGDADDPAHQPCPFCCLARFSAVFILRMSLARPGPS